MGREGPGEEANVSSTFDGLVPVVYNILTQIIAQIQYLVLQARPSHSTVFSYFTINMRRLHNTHCGLTYPSLPSTKLLVTTTSYVQNDTENTYQILHSDGGR